MARRRFAAPVANADCHCEPTGPRFARPDDRLREAIQIADTTTHIVIPGERRHKLREG